MRADIRAVIAALALTSCSQASHSEKTADQPDAVDNASKSAVQSSASSIVVRCYVGDYEGDCDFSPPGSDAFSIRSVDGEAFFEDVIEISVDDVEILDRETGMQARLSANRRNGEIVDFGVVYRRGYGPDPCWENDRIGVCIRSK